METIESFGQWVRARRSALHLTQGELAKRIYCSEIMVRKIEGDERRPSVEIAERLAVELGVPGPLQPRFVKVARGEQSVAHLPDQPATATAMPAWPVLQQASRPPAPTTSFLGRTQELAQVCELVTQPDTRLLTLVGPPGIGKTRLALHIAGELQHAFVHGVTYVPLAPLRDAGLVVDAIAQLLGYGDSAFGDPLDFLRAELHTRHRLLVLDNFEHVLPAALAVAAIVAAAPRVTVLVTSRTPLNLSFERLWPVPPLRLPEPARTLPVEVAIRQPAVQLFVTRARDGDPGFELTDDNVQAVCELCRRVDGLPLAIELAAARIRLFPPQALLVRLGERLDFLAGAALDRPARHQTLHNAIAWSVELLPQPAQRVYAHLGVFLHGATVEAAQTVSTASTGWRGDVVAVLALLVDHSLVRAERDAEGNARFSMLETTRDYALELLLRRNELDAARRVHARYFLDWSEAHAFKLLGRERKLWAQRFEREADNLRAALTWAEEAEDTAILARLAASLGWFWELHGRRNEARRWLAAVEATPQVQQPPLARARILHMLGHIAGEEGDLERSRLLAEQALALARTAGDEWTAALALRDLDWVYYAADNQVDRAVATAETAANGLLACGDQRNHILALLDAAMICQLTGDVNRGERFAHTALHLAQAWDDAPSAGEALSALGMLAYTAGDFGRALPMLHEALATAAELPNGKQIAWAHYKLAQVLLDDGSTSQAAEHFAESARLWQERGEVLAVAYCHSGQANCLFRQGAIRQAEALHRSVLTVYEQFSARRAIAWTYWNLACLAAVAGNGGQAEDLLAKGLAIFQERNDTRGIAASRAALQGDWVPMREPVRE